jgi:hypothetical protein
MVLFALDGIAVFLSWPILVGPPLVMLALVMLLERKMSMVARLGHAAVAVAPIGLVACVYGWHRTQFLRIAGTAGEATWPSIAIFGWPLLILAALGFVLVLTSRARATGLLILAIGGQSAALYVFATSNHNEPYMALKTLYLAAYPMGVLAVVSIAWVWERIATLSAGAAISAGRRDWTAITIAWMLIAAAGWMVARPLAAAPRILRKRPPAMSRPLYEAGSWVRGHVPPACVEYLVGNDNRAYWLHLAVLDNRRLSDRSANPQSFEPQDALVRWLSPGSLPYAIADLPALPRSVREDLDLVQSFGSAAVVRQRSPAPCNALP